MWMQEKSAQIIITRAAIQRTSSISMTCASTHCHITTLWLLLPFDYHRVKGEDKSPFEMDKRKITPNLVKMPVEPIFIICNCAEEGDSQAAGSPDFFWTCSPILMLPHNAMVFLMHAHTVFNRLNPAMEVCEVRIKVLDVPKTVTPLQIWSCNYVKLSLQLPSP